MTITEPGIRTDVLRHKVGFCPACRGYLWAEVTLVSRVNQPTLSVDGKTAVYASAEAVAMAVQHQCDRREDPAGEGSEGAEAAVEGRGADSGAGLGPSATDDATGSQNGCKDARETR